MVKEMVGREKMKNRILIWGTGNIAKEMIDNGFEADIVGFIQTNKTENIFMGKEIYSFDKIDIDYDYIVVANMYSDEIYELCAKNNMDLGRIVFLVPARNRAKNQEVDLQNVCRILGEANYSLYCEKRGLWEETYIVEDIKKYNELNQRENLTIQKENLWPIISDKFAKAGTMGNYFWQDLWAARHIVSEQIKEHYDIGSRIDGFIAHLLSAGIKVNMIDIRPFPGEVENLFTIVDDATMLNNIEDNSLNSLSALCSIEHFGLGRYGDPIDPEACFKCFSQIQKKMKSGGKVYISLPIGRERVEFNAHRVFYASTIIESFYEMELIEFSCVAEGKIEYNVEIHKYDNDMHKGEHRYGLFCFRKN